MNVDEIVDALQISDIAISPNGAHVLYATSPYSRKGAHKKSQLWIADVGVEKSSRPVTTDGQNFRQPRWSPSGERAACLSDDGDGESCVMYTYDVPSDGDCGGDIFQITDDKCKTPIEGFEWSPDGKGIAYLRPDERVAREEEASDVKVFTREGDHEINRLWLVDSSGETSKLLVREDVHITTFAWSPSGNQIIYVSQERPGDNHAMYHGVDFSIIEVYSGSSRKISHFPSDIWLPGLAWCKDSLYFIGNIPAEESNSAKGCYRLDLDTSKWSLHLTKDVSAVEVKPIRGSDEVAIKTILAIYQPIRLSSGEVIYSEASELETWDVHRNSEGDHTVVLGMSNATFPPEILSFDTVSQSFTQLSSHVQYPFGRYEAPFSSMVNIIKVPTENAGHVISVFVPPHELRNDVPYYFRSQAPSPKKPLPTAVILHGGPYFTQTQSFLAPHQPWTAALLKSGKYAVLLANYRGNFGHGDEFVNSIKGEAGIVDYDDVIHAVDDGVRKGWIDKERIVIGGTSWGGYLSLLAAVRNGHDSQGRETGWKFRGAICAAATCDMDMAGLMSEATAFREAVNGSLPWTAATSDTGTRQGSAIWEFAGAARQQRIPPLLIVHGEQDPIVDCAQAKALWKACERWDWPKEREMVIYPREGHTIDERAHLTDLLRRITAFCEKHLA